MNWESFGNFDDILYHKGDGVAKVTINRPQKRNAFRPKTVSEMYEAFLDAREDRGVAPVVRTGSRGQAWRCVGGSVGGRCGCRRPFLPHPPSAVVNVWFGSAFGL